MKGIGNFGIVSTYDLNVDLRGYSNSNRERYPNDTKSISDYASSIGSVITSWSSKRQPSDSLTSTKVEYKALSSETCEAIWIRRTLEDMGEKK